MTTPLRSVAPVQSIATLQASCASQPELASSWTPPKPIAPCEIVRSQSHQLRLPGHTRGRSAIGEPSEIHFGGYRSDYWQSSCACQRSKPFCDPRKTAIMEDGGSHGTKCTDPYYLRVKAISSERVAFSGVHFRVMRGSLLRPARGQLRYRRPIAGKGRSDRGYRPREASPGPRSSDNGVRREPAAHVTGARLPNYPRGSA
jgi:hypothetical protein